MQNARLALATVGLLIASPAPAAEPEPVSPLLAGADAERGARLFKKCKACHTVEKGGKRRLGPNLWDVVGRPVANRAGFKYSKTLKSLGGDWDYERLSRFLLAPKRFAPKTRMAFPGLKRTQDRADVIAYLRLRSDRPAPLPEPMAASLEKTPARPRERLPEADEIAALPEGKGREEVVAYCGACHSLKLVTQQGLTRERWDELLVWMVEKQSMQPLPADERKLVLDYLAAHVGVGTGAPVDLAALPEGKGREEVEAYCGACHSLKLVTQQGLSRDAWDELLDWMVEEQEMEALEPAERKLVLDYLAKHVGIDRRRRAQRPR